MADGKNKKVKDIIAGNNTPQPHETHGLEQPQSQIPSDPLADITGQIFENPAPPAPQVIPTVDASSPKEQPLPQQAKETTKELPGTGELKAFSQQNPQSTPQATNIYNSGKKKLNWKIALVGFFATILIGFGITTLIKGDVYWVRDMLGMGLPSDPSKAIQKAEKNTGNLNSYKSDASVEIQASLLDEKFNLSMGATTEMDNVNNNYKSTIEIKDIVIPKSFMGMDLPAEIDETVSEIKSKASKIELASFEKDKEIYVKLDGLNQNWYKIEGFPGVENLSNFSVLSSNDRQLSNPFLGSVMYSQDLGIKVNNELEISSYINEARKLKDEVIEGERAYHYSASIDIARLMNKFNVSDIEASEIEKYLKNTTLDVWVAKKNLVITKIELNLNMDMSSELQGMGAFNVEVKISEDIKDYNLPVSVEKPTNAKNLDEKTLAEMFDVPIDIGTESPGDYSLRNTQRETDIKTIQTALEQYFTDNNKYPAISDDTKDESFLEELKGGYLVKVPVDPNNPKYYYGYSSANGSSYTLTYINEKADGTVEVKTAKSN